MKKIRSAIHFLFFRNGLKSVRSGKVRSLIFLSKVIMVILAFNMISGCYYYKAISTTNPGEELFRPYLGNNKVFVIHEGTSVYLLNVSKIENDSLKGTLSSDTYSFPYKRTGFPEMNTSPRYRRTKGDLRILNEVHLYIDTKEITQIPGTSISLKDIHRCDVYFNNYNKTAFVSIFGTIGIIAGTFIAVNIVILLYFIFSGASCPFIYVNTDDGLKFAGEIYSGAIYAPMERNDYLALPQLIADDGSYKLRISNELQEVQHTNLAELIVIDHPAKSEVLLDKYGNYQTFSDILAPLKAINLRGMDVLDLVKERDSICYVGTDPQKEIPLTDGLILTFDPPDNARSAKVIIRARNSLWLEYVYKDLHELLGNYNDNWTRKQNGSNPEKLKEWPLSQKIPLLLFVEKNESWKFQDYYNMIGPMALKEDVISINLDSIGTGPLKIKLESGTYFWEIDYVGIDYSINIPVRQTTITLNKAIAEDEDNVADLLMHDDLKYYVQSEEHTFADLTFRVPENAGDDRTVILHSKGYYNINQKNTGLPQIKKLNASRKPGQFLEYSRELMETKVNQLYGTQ
ncbi:MAG: hypothetical protein NTW82_13815 [Bacteroidia bacterium]|nr:hypothetical protein [Bacteroidia bacterium]